MADDAPQRRRSYGTGQLWARRDAGGRETWYGRWYVGRQRIQRKIGPKRQRGERDGLTRAQAETELRRVMELQQPAGVTAGRETVAEVGAMLVTSLEARGRKPSTLAAHESALRVHLVPFFGDRPVSRIDAATVEAFIANEIESGSAPKSIRNYLGTLHSVFDHARVRPNPVEDARRPETDDVDADIRFLTDEEVEALLRAVSGGPKAPIPGPQPDAQLAATCRVLYLTAAWTGLRQGELFALRWHDVDWLAKRIRVRRSYSRKRGDRQARFGKPKSKRSSRSVPMHDRVAGELEQHFKRSSYRGDDDLVFPHPQTGNPLDSSNVLKHLRRSLRAAGVRPVRFHDLRHTFGTRMAAAGVPMRTLQEWMGHRDIKTTMIYADYAPSDQEHELVMAAFASAQRVPELSETERNSEAQTAPDRA